MLTQYKRSWVLLTSFASCAGLAATPAFAVEPHAVVQLVQVADAQCEGNACNVRVGLIGGAAQPQPVENAQIAYLIKLLESSSQFRVRAQAAISLGVMESSSVARNALAAALQDEHPAVRAAAATSLGHIGDANHVIALRMLAGDPEEPVRKAASASIDRIENMMLIVLESSVATATLSANRL